MKLEIKTEKTYVLTLTEDEMSILRTIADYDVSIPDMLAPNNRDENKVMRDFLEAIVDLGEQ